MCNGEHEKTIHEEEEQFPSRVWLKARDTCWFTDRSSCFLAQTSTEILVIFMLNFLNGRSAKRRITHHKRVSEAFTWRHRV